MRSVTPTRSPPTPSALDPHKPSAATTFRFPPRAAAAASPAPAAEHEEHRDQPGSRQDNRATFPRRSPTAAHKERGREVFEKRSHRRGRLTQDENSSRFQLK